MKNQRVIKCFLIYPEIFESNIEIHNKEVCYWLPVQFPSKTTVMTKLNAMKWVLVIKNILINQPSISSRFSWV